MVNYEYESDGLSVVELMYRGDADSWRGYLASLPAAELYQLGDDIAGLIQHPVSARWHVWRGVAGARLGAVLGESWSRWRAVWYDECNADVSDSLSQILETSSE